MAAEKREVKGLVTREAQTGAADEILTLLTAEYGKITVSGKGVRSLRSKHAASAQLFAYSNLLLHKPKHYYYIDDSLFIENFMGIRYDLEKLALATYLCDVASEFALEDIPNPSLMQMTLNALYAIAYRDDIPLNRIKAAFEFRVMCEEGFAPELYGCGLCGCDMTETGYLDVMNGRVLCRSCQEQYVNSAAYAMDEATAKIHVRLTPAVLCAMRYIQSAPMKRLLSFQLESGDADILAVACERYLINHLEHSFSSLEYYHALRENRL